MRQSKSKRLWQNRSLARKDVMLSFVCVIAIFGGILIFQSYADKNHDTAKAGAQVKLSKLTPKNSQVANTYIFATTKGLTYCLMGEAPSVQQISISISYASKLGTNVVTYSQPSNQIGCFKALEDSKATTVSLSPPEAIKPLELQVYDR